MAVPMAVVLSMAQPAIDRVPEMTVFGAGVSMLTLGRTTAPPTVTVTLAEPVSGVGASVSLADTVMVCGPRLSGAVSSSKLKPTLGQPSRPG